MNVTMDPASFARTRPLPESIGVVGGMLFAGDCAAGIIVLGFAGLLFHSAISAFFVIAATLVSGALLGRYRQSLAVLPHDEWYAAFAVAVPGTIVGGIVSAAFGFSALAAVCSAVVWIGAAGAIGMWLHRLRRHGAVYAGAVLRVRSQPRSASWRMQQSILRGMDLVIASVALVVLSPLLAGIAIAIVADDGFPALFVQTRTGRDDVEFPMYKFRTMRLDAGTKWAQPGDDRVTRVGAFLRRASLDELPQLWNVLRGEMSIVGPRPEMNEYAERFARQYQFYSQRHMVRPGITGWAQLYLPRHLQPDDAPIVMQYDLFFVDISGIYVYLHCLAKTASEIFSHRAL